MSRRSGSSFARFVAPAIVVTGVLAACGPRVSTVETAEVRAREEGAEVLVYVRDRDGLPSCPWEVLGTVEVKPGWFEDPSKRRGAERSAVKLGGHALMAENAAATEARILRFFDPLCNPLREE